MLLTEIEAATMQCPFRGGDCLASRCFVFRASKLVDRRNGQRLFFCGAGGQAGAWNPWAASAREVAAPVKQENPAGSDDRPATEGETQG